MGVALGHTFWCLQYDKFKINTSLSDVKNNFYFCHVESCYIRVQSFIYSFQFVIIFSTELKVHCNEIEQAYINFSGSDASIADY